MGGSRQPNFHRIEFGTEYLISALYVHSQMASSGKLCEW